MFLTITTKDGERHEARIPVPPELENIAWRYDNIRDIQLDCYVFYPHDSKSALKFMMDENTRLKRTIDALLNKAGV